jgi:single-strand DNA-binding protein
MFSFGSYDRREVIGRLGKTPEVKEIGEKKTKVVTFSVAVDHYDPKAENKRSTEWVNCQSFNEQVVKQASEHCAKGAVVFVAGEMRTRSYEKDGEKRTVSELNVFDMVKIADGKSQSAEGTSEAAPAQATAAAAPASQAPLSDPGDDIPF